MTEAAIDTADLAVLQEQLRQERETFDQLKAQDQQWFKIRYAMGWMAFFFLPVIAVFCGWVIVEHRDFPDAVVVAATGALLTDILGFVFSIWRIFIGPTPRQLGPVTSIDTSPRTRSAGP